MRAALRELAATVADRIAYAPEVAKARTEWRRAGNFRSRAGRGCGGPATATSATRSPARRRSSSAR